MPGDHSELVPPLPIPNRTVKRLHADDSADSRVKVGNRQALHQNPRKRLLAGVLLLWRTLMAHTYGAHRSGPLASTQASIR